MNWRAAGVIGLGTAVTAAAIWAFSGVSVAGVRSFYIPSEAMEPTLENGDHFIAAMSRPKELQRGQLVLIRTSGGDIYVKRLAALPGDTIALAKGIVSINGQPVQREAAGRRRVAYPYLSATEAFLFREQFPGEQAPHLIQDLGPSSEDDMAEVTMPPGRVFALGDNRDNSADSRVPKFMGGLELVPIEDVVGRPLFFTWPAKKMGSSVEGPSR